MAEGCHDCSRFPGIPSKSAVLRPLLWAVEMSLSTPGLQTSVLGRLVLTSVNVFHFHSGCKTGTTAGPHSINEEARPERLSS